MIILLAPFVPHIANELWQQLGHSDRLDQVPWPGYSEAALAEDRLLIVVQVNGKVRGKISASTDMNQSLIEAEALKDEKVRSIVGDKKVQKIVYVPGRLVNIVVEG